MAFKVREALLSDCEEVAILIQESPDTGGDQTSKLPGQVLARDAFCSDPPTVRIIVAEDTQLKKVIGYSLYFQTYSMWKGKALHVESVHVQQSLPNRHAVGNAMLTYLARIADKENFSKISFESKITTPETDGSKESWITKYGAEDVTVSENWLMFHFVNNVV